MNILWLLLVLPFMSHAAVIDRAGNILINEKGDLVGDSMPGAAEEDDFVMVEESPLEKALQGIGWNKETIHKVMNLSPKERLRYLAGHQHLVGHQFLPGYKTPKSFLDYCVRKEHTFCDHYASIRSGPENALYFEKEWLRRKFPPLPDGAPSYQKTDNSLSLPSFEFYPWGIKTKYLVSFVFSPVAPEYLHPALSDKKSTLIQELKRITQKIWQGEVSDAFLPTGTQYVIHLYKKHPKEIEMRVVGILSRTDEQGQYREEREMEDFIKNKIYPLISAGLKHFLINDQGQHVSDFHPPLRRPETFVWVTLKGATKCLKLPTVLTSFLIEGLTEAELNRLSDNLILKRL